MRRRKPAGTHPRGQARSRAPKRGTRARSTAFAAETRAASACARRTRTLHDALRRARADAAGAEALRAIARERAAHARVFLTGRRHAARGTQHADLVCAARLPTGTGARTRAAGLRLDHPRAVRAARAQAPARTSVIGAGTDARVADVARVAG